MNDENMSGFLTDDQFRQWSDDQERRHRETLEEMRRPRTAAEAAYSFWQGVAALMWMVVVGVASFLMYCIDQAWQWLAFYLMWVPGLGGADPSLRQRIAAWVVLGMIMASFGFMYWMLVVFYRRRKGKPPRVTTLEHRKF